MRRKLAALTCTLALVALLTGGVHAAEMQEVYFFIQIPLLRRLKPN